MRYLEVLLPLFLIAILSAETIEKYKDSPVIKLDEFILSSCKNDPGFQYILSEKLTLEYDKKLSIPVSEFFFDATGSYGVNFEGEHFPQLKSSLKKLMPHNGSSVEVYLESAYLGNTRKNALGITYNIEFLKNAFGRTHALYYKQAKLSEEIALFQILQSYESYLAKLILYYYDWIKSYNNMLAAEVSYEEALKLLENVEKKKKWYIAYQVDVDKAKLQAVDKRELLRSAEEEFNNISIQILYSLGDSLNDQIIPDTGNFTFNKAENAENLVQKIDYDSTRSGKIFNSIINLDSLEMILAMEDLLPSLTGFGTFEVGERDGNIRSNSIVSTGVALSFPFKTEHEKAKVEKLRIEQKKTTINSNNVKQALQLNLAQLVSDISFQKESIEISKERLELAQKIYEAEEKDYQSGRSSLNDLIQAQNTIQKNRLAKFNSKINLAKKRLLIIEALDMLVTKIEK